MIAFKVCIFVDAFVELQSGHVHWILLESVAADGTGRRDMRIWIYGYERRFMCLHGYRFICLD